MYRAIPFGDHSISKIGSFYNSWLKGTTNHFQTNGRELKRNSSMDFFAEHEILCKLILTNNLAKIKSTQPWFVQVFEAKYCHPEMVVYELLYSFKTASESW
jgi:hypothetical protein